MKAFKLSIVFLFVCVLLTFVPQSSAETTPYRSASTITSNGIPPFTNLSNCSTTDGLTCDRAPNIRYANLYFQNFEDFGIPDGSVLSSVRLRVTGRTTNTSPLHPTVGVSNIIGNTSGCGITGFVWGLAVLNSPTIKVYTANTPITTGGLVSCLSLDNIRTNNFIFNIHYAPPPNSPNWSMSVDNFELAFDYTPPPEPPEPVGPEPFLELPWDYAGKGLSFNEAALAINSFFDHEYPLLSSGLGEQADFLNKIRAYDGIVYPKEQRSYSSHDGYDYGTPAKVEFGDPVLAAADGMATYINSCGDCGNAIHIDHGNGYQSRYYHLQEVGLITNIPGQKVSVIAGQQIGKVGATGNVLPMGEPGAHIHFMVVQDKNNDGNFEDNIPDGLTDPFGWQSKDPDPWRTYEFSYGGVQWTGNSSFYLWKKKLDSLDATLTANGGVFSSGKTSANFPPGATSQNLKLEMFARPIENISNTLRSVGSSVEINAKNLFGNLVTTFTKPFIVTINFSEADLSKFNLGTLSIYSSEDGEVWKKEESFNDFLNKNSTTEVNHLSYFALFAERKDATPPATLAHLHGEKGHDSWYLSPVEVVLQATDSADGLGIDYTLYKTSGGDWEGYTTPLQFTENGKYDISFYSIDKDENIEEEQNVSFGIDTIPPEAKIFFDPNSSEIAITGHDASDTVDISRYRFTNFLEPALLSDEAGNTLRLGLAGFGYPGLSKVDIKSLQYNKYDQILLENNSLIVTYMMNRKKKLTKLDQLFLEHGKTVLILRYNQKKNLTSVFSIERGREKLTQTVAGMRILQLSTENGTLKYSY